MARLENFSITQDGINFSNVTPASFNGGGLTASSEYTNADEQTASAKFINAVDIDWNGAVVGGSTINTTGQLLKKIADLESALSTLANNVSTLVTVAN